MKKRKRSNPLKEFGGMATGLASVSISTAVGAGAAAKAPAGTPSLTAGFSTLAGFAPLAVTAGAGKTLIGMTRKLKKRRI